MNDNQKLFAAFLILLIASLNANLSLTGKVTYVTTGPGAPTGNWLTRFAGFYCLDKGDLNGDGIIDKDDIVEAIKLYQRDRVAEARNYVYELDIYPVDDKNRKCGDGKVTYMDLITLKNVVQNRMNENRNIGGTIKERTCRNECRYAGYISGSEYGGMVCGNWDDDACLEWKQVECPAGRRFVRTESNDFLCVSGQAFEGFGVLEGTVRAKQ